MEPGYQPDPIRSARRNLTQRIESFSPGRPLTPFEDQQVELAKGCLLLGQYRHGEDCMFRAERADLFGPRVD